MALRPAIRAAQGRWSGPVAQFGLMSARAFSHHSGVAGCRKRVGVECGGDGVVVSGLKTEELTEVKWVLRENDGSFELKADQFSGGPEEALLTVQVILPIPSGPDTCCRAVMGNRCMSLHHL